MLRRNLVANYVGQGWSALMGLAFIPLYIKYLGIEAYGLIGLFAVLQACLGVLDLSITPCLSREMARFLAGAHTSTSIRDLLRSAESIAILGALLFAGGIALSATWFASSWINGETVPESEVAIALGMMGVVASLRLVEGMYRGCVIGLQRQVFLNVTISVMATLRGVGSIAILAWVSPTLHAFFLWQGLVSVASLFIFAKNTYRSLTIAERAGRFSINALREVWQFASGMMGITFLALLLTQADKIILSRLLPLTEYGYYTFAAIVAAVPTILVVPIAQAWFPRLSQLHAASDQIGLARTYHHGAQLVSAITGTSGIVLIIYSEIFLNLWTQDEGLAARTAPLLSLLALGNLLNALMWMPHQTLLALGCTAPALRINAVAAILILPTLIWVAPRYGAQGAAWVLVILNLGYVTIGAQVMFSRMRAVGKWKWYVEDMITPLLFGTLISMCLSLLSPFASSYVQQLCLIVTAVFLTFAASIFGASNLRQEIRRVALHYLKYMRQP